jgi:hypothetical protein
MNGEWRIVDCGTTGDFCGSGPHGEIGVGLKHNEVHGVSRSAMPAVLVGWLEAAIAVPVPVAAQWLRRRG